MKVLSVTAVVLVTGVASFTAPAMGELVGNVRGGDHKAHAPRLSRAVVSPSESPTATARGGSVEVRAESSEAVEPAAAGGSTVAPLAPSTPRALTYEDWLAVKHFPASEQMRAFYVQQCESRGQDEAVGRAGEVGRFQIHPIHFERFADLDLTDPEDNGRAAVELWGEAGWRAWSCAH